MTLFKEKKKNTNEKNKPVLQTTVENKHNEIIRNYKELKKQVPLKKNLINSYQNELNSLCSIPATSLNEEQIERKLFLREQINNIDKEIKSLESEQSLKDYLLNTGHMLYMYFDENDYNKKTSKKRNSGIGSKKSVLDFFLKKSNNTPANTDLSSNTVSEKQNISISINQKSKGEIMDTYLSLTDKNHVRKVNDIPNENFDNCKICNEQRIFNTVSSTMLCPSCGNEEKMLVDTETPSYKEPPREITYFAYKKINHFNEWLSQFQAKESTDIPEEIFEQIENELSKERYLNKKVIKASKVRDILKKLHLTKYYEHCHYITNRITGRPAPEIDEELQEKIRNMFKQIQGPWMRFCPSERSNLLSYPYIFYKFFQLLGRDEYLSFFRLLKSREKLQEHDEIWKKICNELKWEYIKTV